MEKLWQRTYLYNLLLCEFRYKVIFWRQISATKIILFFLWLSGLKSHNCIVSLWFWQNMVLPMLWVENNSKVQKCEKLLAGGRRTTISSYIFILLNWGAILVLHNWDFSSWGQWFNLFVNYPGQINISAKTQGLLHRKWHSVTARAKEVTSKEEKSLLHVT